MKKIKSILKRIAMFLFKEHIEQAVKDSILKQGFDIIKKITDENWQYFLKLLEQAEPKITELNDKIESVEKRYIKLNNGTNEIDKIIRDKVEIQMLCILDNFKFEYKKEIIELLKTKEVTQKIVEEINKYQVIK